VNRLSIGYVVPGHNLLASAGPTRNVLCLADALSRWADITVAFRRVLEPIDDREFDVVEIEPGLGHSRPSDDAAVRGTGALDFAAYLRTLRGFVDERLHRHDIVLEKSWLLSGYVTARCRRSGIPAAVVENIVRVWHRPLRTPGDVASYVRHRITQGLVGRYLRQAPLIITETEELRAAISGRWNIPSARLEVIGLGVNTELFRPRDQDAARRALGIDPRATVLLYVGVLDRVHDLAPVLEAMGAVEIEAIELHVVGNGELRGEYESRARSASPGIVFHGRVPHVVVPEYIAAADLCMAPYDPAAFPDGKIGYSTLKIPEYMACARPVVSVPSGHVLQLVRDGVTGFLFSNEAEPWMRFLRSCPPRERLARMGETAAQLLTTSGWDEVARSYLAACQRLVAVQAPHGGIADDGTVTRA